MDSQSHGRRSSVALLPERTCLARRGYGMTSYRRSYELVQFPLVDTVVGRRTQLPLLQRERRRISARKVPRRGTRRRMVERRSSVT